MASAWSNALLAASSLAFAPSGSEASIFAAASICSLPAAMSFLARFSRAACIASGSASETGPGFRPLSVVPTSAEVGGYGSARTYMPSAFSFSTSTIAA